MKRTFITAALLASYLVISAQKRNNDPVYTKQKISQTEIQVLLSYYTQDGKHSAVTGGIGTENLQVYSTDLSLVKTRDSVHTFEFDVGIDMITSASTDKIDFVVSSASKTDNHFDMNAGYSRLLKKSNLRVGISSGLALESDYLSVPLGVAVSHNNTDRSRQWSVALQCYFDDLRWGRFDPKHYAPETLIYPIELRGTNWFDIYRRTSYNLNMSLYQAVNQRVQFAIFPEAVYQKGLLSTPFHRVYFNDKRTLKVENLPRERWKFPLGVQLNMFVGNRTIIRSYYRFYRDNFGITGHTFQLEVPIKTSPQLTISPLIRFYTQTKANYFKPYQEHDVHEAFYTSDYDLSKFNTYKAGISARYALFKPVSGRYSVRGISLRYEYYKRSDTLAAHMISLLLDFKKQNS